MALVVLATACACAAPEPAPPPPARPATAEELEASRRFVRDALGFVSQSGNASVCEHGYGLVDGVDLDALRAHLRRLLSERPVPESGLGLEATIYADLVGTRFADRQEADPLERGRRLDALLAEGAATSPPASSSSSHRRE